MNNDTRHKVTDEHSAQYWQDRAEEARVDRTGAAQPRAEVQEAHTCPPDSIWGRGATHLPAAAKFDSASPAEPAIDIRSDGESGITPTASASHAI